MGNRNKCPVCNGDDIIRDWRMKFALPENYPLPKENIVCLCENCGFIYYDNDGTQEDYDLYYLRYYGNCLNNIDNAVHLRKLAIQIWERYKSTPSMKIVDYGGGEGMLVSYLKELGFTDVAVLDVGQPYHPKEDVDLLITTHTLEHIFNLENTMNLFQDLLKYGGEVLVEIPDALAYSQRKTPPILDYQTKHINHFTPFALDYLFNRYGFTVKWQEFQEFEPLSARCYRVIYTNDLGHGIYYSSMKSVLERMDKLVQKLKQVKVPVIMWGMGDTAWYVLDKVPELDVVYFVDMDTKAYPKGSRINGKNVIHAPYSNEPIVVCAQGMKENIIKTIHKLGLKNEIIEI
jgi:hypothetical protein